MRNYLSSSFPLHQQLYALQLFEYQPGRYFRWWLNNWSRFHLERKKSLVWTAKARFLFFCSLIMPIFVIGTVPLFIANVTFVTSVTLVTITLLTTLLTTAFPQLFLLLSLLILRPYELLNRRKTIKQVQETIQGRSHLKIIGITGSYGKTSVKDILAQVLSLKYKVLATPQSYNTLFGIASFLREKLKDNHEILIVEMGAYQKGEIRELCRMVPPHIGIITGITDQHLERFGSRENIAAAKYELIEALPPDGLSVFNLDSPALLSLYQKTKITKISCSRNNPQVDISSNSNVIMYQSGNFQQTFDLIIHPSKSPHPPPPQFSNFPPLTSNIQLNLPGQHQISNALAAAAVALHLGLTPEQIREGLAKVQPPSHRLQLLPQSNGTLIIDDAYSSNPEGVKAAVDLIIQLSNSPKIIVTPGLVELGLRQVEENINFGKLIATHFDYAVIVNKTNRDALLKGLLERSNLQEKTPPTAETSEPRWLLAQQGASLVSDKATKKVFLADHLDQATHKILPHLVQPDCLILFENDLPDIYI